MLHDELFKNINTSKNVKDLTPAGIIECPLCNEKFDQVYKLTKHLLDAHNYKVSDIYILYGLWLDDTKKSGLARCHMCGKEFELSKCQWQGLTWNNEHKVGCCTSCSRKYQNMVHKQGFGNPANKEKAKQTFLSKYGVDHNFKIPEVRKKWEDEREAKYGFRFPSQTEIAKQHSQETCLSKYGTDWPCQTLQCREANKFTRSKHNIAFENWLVANNIIVEHEYNIGHKSFDFYLPDLNLLVELNPTCTHKCSDPIRVGGVIKDPMYLEYHKQKSELGQSKGFQVMHIWDWDNRLKLIEMLKPKQSIGARECEVKLIDNRLATNFIDMYHLQGQCQHTKYSIGLFYKNELVQVMTFGKPRYNKKYEYELLRLCTKFKLTIMGGANKLFKYFINKYKPTSIISYCDLSKFSGKVYEQLNFQLLRTSIGIHWYNERKTVPEHLRHITDSLLRQRGVDQLLGTSYGKGTNNQELMLKHGYHAVADAGQATYVWLANQVS